ncbi:16S rRNA (cytidine(1402)-2'-O)-methyltransferase [Acholeplasma granularum]|uniref:16S rRNA (cytidine(1402)-2'-O)-methyltransferase n=1 Tax=Acholeplasma granularum TaxID=264635 RepID=UPI000471A442|nr:16S rRNA (cytidine(1402)-2'-O)-methyltransferase [Acholeplasma granularum]
MKTQVSFTVNQPTLYIVSTPIGNLSDMTFRAVSILESVNLILAEDTRVTGILLKHYNIKTPMLSYQKFNEQERLIEIIDKLKQGESVALVSDAGTPLVNDPGFLLVKSAVLANINVVSIPGASAVLAGLASSGINPQPFTFIGFLPRKQKEASNVLKDYENRKETLIIYESPLRIKMTLELILSILGNRNLSIGRELTKMFETIYRGDINSILEHELDTRGEYVIIVEGDLTIIETSKDPVELVDYYISQGNDEKEALKLAAKDLKVHKSEIYKLYKIKK